MKRAITLIIIVMIMTACSHAARGDTESTATRVTERASPPTDGTSTTGQNSVDVQTSAAEIRASRTAVAELTGAVMVETSRPTRTPYPPSPTPSPGRYQTPYPLRNTAIIETLIATVEPVTLATLESPDRKWRVETKVYTCTEIVEPEPTAYERMDLIEVETGATTMLTDQLLNCGGMGAGGLAGLSWSPNSENFYFTDAREGVPDGYCWSWYPNIYFSNLNDRKVTLLGGGVLSHDQTKLVYWQWPERDLVIWDLDLGEIGRVPAINEQASLGPLSWSPDSQAVVYIQKQDDCSPTGKSYLAQYNLGETSSHLLLTSEEPTFYTVSWDAPKRIKLYTYASQEWEYDLVSQELVRLR